MLNLSRYELADRVADYKALGVEWARFDFDWSVVQPNGPTDYNVGELELVVRALSAASINILGIIDYTPSWANGCKPSKFYPPIETADYAAYAGYLAAHFGPMGVHAWEIWNEPNLSQFWQPAPDVAAYTTLLKAAYLAIHQAYTGSRVIVGGLAQPGDSSTTISALEFLSGVYRNGGQGYFDAVADHPYISPELPGSPHGTNWQKMFATPRSILSIMSDNGDSNKELWITEFGAPTKGVSAYGTVISEERQSEVLARAYELVSTYSWAGPLFWYNYKDYCRYGTDSECYYGIVRYDNSQKPSYSTYRLMNGEPHRPR